MIEDSTLVWMSVSYYAYFRGVKSNVPPASTMGDTCTHKIIMTKKQNKAIHSNPAD